MAPMGWLTWVVVGVIAGWLANRIVANRFGLIDGTIVGMVGALLGGFLFEQVGSFGATGFNIWSIIVAFVGAIVLLIVIRAVDERQTART